MVSFKDICYIRKVYNRYTPHNKSDGIITTPVFVEAAYVGLSQMKNRRKNLKILQNHNLRYVSNDKWK